MTDRFKFRVFDLRENKYLDIPTYITQDGRFVDKSLEEDWFGGRYVHEMAIGKKDKNGKLIYENDVVKDINGHYGYIKWDGEELKYFVYKRLGIIPYCTPCSMVHSYEYEIVGNIHNNEYLLEGNNDF